MKLVGHKSNRDGIGAQVEGVSGSLRRLADDPRLHFGLGTAAKVDRITVTWPGGGKQVVESPAVDRLITMEEKLP